MIYHPELLTCPHCGALLVLCSSLAWDKTVQMLDCVLAVASRPGRCPRATCTGARMRILSAAGQRIAPLGASYGYDVLVHMAWWRQEPHATYREMHTALASQVPISVSHVGYLYQQVSVPLLACHERQHRDRLAQIATPQGGVIVALDGLAPQGGEPHMWFIRALSSGVTWRSGWLCQQDQPTFEAFLEPLKHLAWPILAVLSDKHTGLIPAVAPVLPHRRHQFCQAHYLRNLAEPLAAAEAAFKGERRKTVREQVGDLIRQEPRIAPGHPGVLTVTGLLPSPLAQPTAPACQSPPPRDALTAPQATAEEVSTQLCRHTRSVLTLTGRPPFRLAGIETSERLQNVARGSLDLLAQRYAPRLAQLSQGLQAALAPFAETSQEFQQGALWRRDIAYIFAPCPTQPLSAAHVAGPLRSSLDTVRRWPRVTPTCSACGRHLDKVSRSSWPGLLHCYDVPSLPRTTNELESHFRETGRRLLRTTGQKGLTQRTLQRQGAWELLPRPLTEAQGLDAMGHTSLEELAQERQRFAAHRPRFRLQSRSLRQTQAQCNQLRQTWSTLQPTGTG